MFSKTNVWAPAMGAAVALTSTSLALAASNGQTYAQKFTTKHPGRPSGMTFRAASQVQAKTVTLTFPAGTKIDTAALKRCATAPNCPMTSGIGSGTATVSIAGATLHLPVAAYNRSGGMVLVVSNPLTPTTPVVLTPALTGRTLKVTLPTLSVAGQPITVTGLQLTVSKIISGRKAYITTPKTCPASRAWTFRGQFTYPNAPATASTSRSPCTKH